MNDKDMKKDLGHKDENRDPITGAPGAHPVGTGIGAAGGGAAGAAIGAAAGPIGAAIGLAAGAIVGGLAGKGVAEMVDPTAEEAYWREHYSTEPYYNRNRRFEDYHPAYRTGYEGYAKYGVHGKRYDEVESDLQRNYGEYRGTSGLDWNEARPATRAAWDRVHHNLNQGTHEGVEPRYSTEDRREDTSMNRTRSERIHGS